MTRERSSERGRSRLALLLLLVAALAVALAVALFFAGSPVAFAPPVDSTVEMKEMSHEELPAFPWPPPKASGTRDLPLAWLVDASATATLADLDARLTSALDRLGYGERSYFGVPGGYALVTRLERIEDDGTPRAGPERWALDDARSTSFSLRDYLRALLLARPGHFRVFVFAVTPRAFAATGAAVGASEALAWIGAGFVRLPDAVGAIPLASAPFHCTVLIYEFERAAEADPAKVVVPGHVEARQHLVRAGLWGALER